MELIKQSEMNPSPSKLELGRARRQNLGVILDKILINKDSYAQRFLNKKGLDKKALCEAIGLDIKPVNLRQSFKEEVDCVEKRLIECGLIIIEDKPQSETENGKIFTGWLNENLSDATFLWPVGHNQLLYRKALWALFTEQNIEELGRTPTLFSRNKAVKDKLKVIDLKLANKELKTSSFASESALEEMQDSMTNTKIASLSQKVKALTEQLASERQEKERIAIELNKLKLINETLLTGTPSSVKLAGVH
jgi:hypothetical protein